MILFALLLAAQEPGSALDAEIAMAAAAQTEGQWTAVRRFAAPEAIVLAPKPTPVEIAYAWKDPTIPFQWRPATSFVSCDGSAAVNTGPWEKFGQSGYFTTVWQRQADGGWKWVLDSGDALAKPGPQPEKPETRTASCRFQRSANSDFATMSAPAGPGHGRSDDGTLLWDWQPEPEGRYSLTVRLWDGHRLVEVLHDIVPDAGEGG